MHPIISSNPERHVADVIIYHCWVSVTLFASLAFWIIELIPSPPPSRGVLRATFRLGSSFCTSFSHYSTHFRYLPLFDFPFDVIQRCGTIGKENRNPDINNELPGIYQITS